VSFILTEQAISTTISEILQTSSIKDCNKFTIIKEIITKDKIQLKIQNDNFNNN